jgi:hypothetical protein
MAEERSRLEMRIKQLEDQLQELRAAREPVDISADEIAAYRKVAGVLAGWDQECGINECHPVLPIRFRPRHWPWPWPCGPCIPCDYECYCGPCLRGPIGGGGGRFGGLGG